MTAPAACDKRPPGYTSIATIIRFVIAYNTNVIVIPRSITGVDTFAERLLFARHLRGLSQSALARASGVSQSAIASYELGTRKSTQKIFRLATALQVDPVWLGMGTGPMETDRAATAPALRDATNAWPFPGIPPKTYWALSTTERQAIEVAVSAMIRAFKP